MTEGSLSEVLRDAMVAHRAGRIDEAETGYHEVLRHRPAEPRALHFLGLLEFHRGHKESGIEHVTRSLEGDPSNPRAWNALGGMLIAVGRQAEAKDAYIRSTQVAQNVAEGWYNLGICLRNEGDVEGAIESLTAALERDANYFRAYEALGMLLYQLERIPEAAQVYSSWAARDPSNPKAQHMAAATSGQNAPVRADDEYVRKLFDDSAETFEANLRKLEYRAPESVARALRERLGGKVSTILDAGCGTGLCGPLIRPQCFHLVGVDLSPNMIERAQALNCYDELVVSELTAFLHWRVTAFDAVISADTLVYFGALEQVLSAAHDSLRAGGWLIFTLEALKDGGPESYRLEAHGRYSHSEAYVRSALNAAGFQLDALVQESFRKERDMDVPGLCVIARRN